jgi:hypothetical protein
VVSGAVTAMLGHDTKYRNIVWNQLSRSTLSEYRDEHVPKMNLFFANFDHCRGGAMTPAIRCFCAILLLMVCDQTRAQFSQPPPDKPPPTCTVVTGQKADVITPNASGGPRCASEDFRTYLHCRMPARSSTTVDCVASAEWFNGWQWVAINPSVLVFDWAFIIDGQEYYMTSGGSDVTGVIGWNSNRYDAVYFDCGRDNEGYVRVTAAGKTDQMAYYCDPWGAYD